MTADPTERIALVLGAGGARGLAQIGVIEAMEARGLAIAAVAGSSSGALVGGFYAAGRLAALRDWLVSLTRPRMLRLLDPTMGGALFEGRRLMAALHELSGDVAIESLPIDLTIVAVDLMRQREVWLRSGDLLDAIRASISIPGLLAPHRLIAVDMHGWPQRPPTEIPLPAHADALASPPSLRAWRKRPHADIGVIERVARSIDTMQSQVARVQLALDPAELVIRIPRDACQFYEFWRARELIELGRRQADKALDAVGY